MKWEANTILKAMQLYTGLVQCPISQEASKLALAELKKNGLVETVHGCPELTRKGDVWVQMILNTELPVQRWVDPKSR